MKKLLIMLLIALMVMISACSPEKPGKNEQSGNDDSFVFVKGGTSVNRHSSSYGKGAALPDFYISKYEVTQQEWMEVMGNNPSMFKGDHLPVETVSWYDAVEYCNLRSAKEGLALYYNINKEVKDPDNQSVSDNIKWTVTVNSGANGYRLPTEAEWEYAAGGGQKSKSYTFSGSNQADEVAWYWRNAGEEYLSGDWNWPIIESNHNTTKPVGGKKPNELGLYDMSGNVREWCWDWYTELESNGGSFRIVKGGGWIGGVSNNEISFRGKFEPNGFGPDQGFRVVRGG